MSGDDDVGNAIVLALVVLVLVGLGARHLYTSSIEAGERNATRIMNQADEVRRKVLEGKLRKERNETARLAKELQAATLELERSNPSGRGPGARSQTSSLERELRYFESRLQNLSPSAKLLLDKDLDLERVVKLSTEGAFADSSVVREAKISRGDRGFLITVELSRNYERRDAFALREAVAANLPRWIRTQWIQELSLLRPGARPLAMPLGPRARQAADACLQAYRERHQALPPLTNRADPRLKRNAGLWVKNGLGRPLKGLLTGTRVTRFDVKASADRALPVAPGRYFLRLDGAEGPWIGWVTFTSGQMVLVDLRE